MQNEIQNSAKETKKSGSQGKEKTREQAHRVSLAPDQDVKQKSAGND